jgi:hypothetical protein
MTQKTFDKFMWAFIIFLYAVFFAVILIVAEKII